MRQITHGDVVAVALAIRTSPEAHRRSEVGRLLERAHTADLYRKRTGRAHPLWGNGSLGATVPFDRRQPEPFLSDMDYLEALSDVLQFVIEWRRRNSAAGRRP